MISSWVKIGIDFIKTLARQWKGRSHGNPPTEPNSGTASECLVTGPDSIVVRLESQINIKTEDSPSRQELERHDGSTETEGLVAIQPESQISSRQEVERRREIVRQFFNDFWRSVDDKPVTFAERLNRAEGYINERLAARGEAWQLDPAIRKQRTGEPTFAALKRAFGNRCIYAGAGASLQLGSSTGAGERRGEGPALEEDDLTTYRKLARREDPFGLRAWSLR
jgi:hypothetical protein